MTLRGTRRLLWTISAALAMALAAVNAALVFSPIEDPHSEASEAKPTPQAQAATGPITPPLEAYATAWGRDLQRPLFDPQPVLVDRTPPPPPKPTVRLLGTVIEPGFTFALLRGKDGSTKCVPVGEALDGAEVLGVQDGSVTVRFAGHTHTLEAEKPGGGAP